MEIHTIEWIYACCRALLSLMLKTSETWKSAIVREPVVCSPNVKLLEAIARFNQSESLQNSAHSLESTLRDTSSACRCVVVVDDRQIVGILSDRDVVEVVRQGCSLESLTLRDVVTPPSITIRDSALTELAVVLQLFRHHPLSHLPVLNDAGHLVGTIAREDAQSLASALFLQHSSSMDASSDRSTRDAVSDTQEPPLVFNANDILTSVRALADSTHLTELFEILARIMLHASGAERFVLLLPDTQNCWQVRVTADAETTELELKTPLQGHPQLPVQLIEHVLHRRARVAIDGLATVPPIPDAYLQQHPNSSILCLPLLHQNRPIGLLYLEHHSSPSLFHTTRLNGLNVLSDRVATALNHALFTQSLEQKLELQTAKPKASEARVRNMVNNVPGVVFQVIVQADGRDSFSYVSPNCHNLYEVTAEAVMGGQYSLRDFEHSEDKPLIDRYLLELNQSLKPFDREFRIITPSGHLKWVHAYSHPSPQPEGSILWDGVIIDVSDRQRYAKDLERLKEQLELAIESAQFGIWEWNQTDNSLLWDERMLEIYGIRPEAFGGTYQDWSSRVHPDDLHDAEAGKDHFDKSNSHTYRQEFRIIRPNGDIRHIFSTASVQRDARGVPIRSVGTSLDITERKATELALQSAQEQFHWMTEHVPGMIYRYVLHPDGRDELTYVSSQIKELFELDPDIALQDVTQVWARIHPEDIPCLRDRIHVAVEHLQPFKESYRLILPEKGIRWVQNMSSVERLDNGDVVWNGIVVDISDRKRAELALREGERRYASLTAAAPVVIYRLDKPLHVSYVNERWSEMTGRPAHSALGYGWMNALHPEDREDYINQWAEIYSLDDIPGEFFMHGSEGRHLRPDGSIQWFYSRLAKEFDKDGRVVGYIGTLTDITNRKQAELALQESQNQFRQMTENVPGMIFSYVLHPDGSDSLTYVSSKVLEIYEVDPKEALQDSTRLWERIHSEDIPWLQDKIQQSADTLQPYQVEYRLNLPQKGLRWVQTMSHPERRSNGDVVWNGVVIDISDRKQTEFTLEQELLRRAALFNASSDGIHVLDIHGNLLEANMSFLQNLGYTEKDAKGLHVKDWDAKVMQDKIAANINLQVSLSSIEKVRTIETIHRRKDGSLLPVEVSICPMEWDGKTSFFCSSRDISERKQAEAKRQKTNEELVRATRLKDEFLANMSHELRTPLNSILGLSEALQEAVFGTLNEQQIKFLQTIEKSGRHLLSLINDILDVSKIESGQINLDIKPVNINRLCDSSLALVKQQSMQKNISLLLNIQYPLPNLVADERRILQALINLLNNAVKFTPSGGSVTLEVSTQLQDSLREANDFHMSIVDIDYPNKVAWESGILRSGNYLRISVVDTGIGISADHINQLFKPFSQIDSALNRKYSGTGLGLVLVKQITELHRGTVSVASEVGVGSCFSINLPLISSDTEVPSQPLTQSPDIKQMSANPTYLSADSPRRDTIPLILLAEDNEDNINTIAPYLQKNHFHLVVASNGLEAVELAELHHPKLILMDIQMPELSGLDAIRRIRQNAQHEEIPIIALTALAMKGDRERCLDAGATMYFSKPFKLKELVSAIETLLASSTSR